MTLTGLPEYLTKAYEAWKGKADDVTVKGLTEAFDKVTSEAAAAAEKAKAPESYKVTDPAEFESKEQLDALTAYAKKLGVNQETFEAMRARERDIRKGYGSELLTGSKAVAEKNKADFVAKHGEKAKELATKAADVAKHIFGADSKLVKDWNETGEGNNPEMVEKFAALYEKLGIGSDTVPDGCSKGGSKKLSESEEWGTAGLNEQIKTGIVVGQ